MRVWRICRQCYAATAFTGEGSVLFPGRWHDGVAMVYTATSIALASVEVFVNLTQMSPPSDLVCIGADVPSDLVTQTELTEAAAFRDATETTQQAGTQWFKDKSSLAMRVPSLAVEGDWNVLLNPEHTRFRQVKVGQPRAFQFDPRMFRHA